MQDSSRVSRAAVALTLGAGLAIAISGFTVARAERAKPDKNKVFSCSSGTACLEGSSSSASTFAVYGVAAGGTGVQGTTNATNGNSGTSGISTGTTGSAHGIYGRSSNGQGVYGTSSSNNGVEGQSTGGGASGVAGIDAGTSSGNGDGVYSESADTSNLYEALEAKADSSNTYIFEGFNAATNGLCTIDYNAALSCTGGAAFKAVRTRHVTNDGRRVLAYAAESAAASIDDVGSGHLVNGVANVAIDSAFAATIDQKSPYYVFLTPMGDTRGLYVSMKSAVGFAVRESQGGRSTVAFDYRIVARPLDAAHDRLPAAPVLAIRHSGRR